MDVLNLLQAADDEYARKKAIVGLTFNIQFENEEQIALDIPKDGSEANGWKIEPYSPPVVSLYCASTVGMTFSVCNFIFSTDHKAGGRFLCNSWCSIFPQTVCAVDSAARSGYRTNVQGDTKGCIGT